MDNAAKALTMAAAVLFAIMILSLLVYFYNSYRAIGVAEQDVASMESIVAFNNQYSTYNRDNVRGNELLSLVNKIIDYNNNQAEYGYKDIDINIIIDSTELSKFKYSLNSVWLPNGVTDLKLEAHLEGMAKDVAEIEKDFGSAQCTAIASDISNITTLLNGGEVTYNNIKYKKSTANTLDDYMNDKYAILISDSRTLELVNTYYEFTQFKRGYFDCTEMKTDDNTGRITSFSFEFNGNIN